MLFRSQHHPQDDRISLLSRHRQLPQQIATQPNRGRSNFVRSLVDKCTLAIAFVLAQPQAGKPNPVPSPPPATGVELEWSTAMAIGRAVVPRPGFDIQVLTIDTSCERAKNRLNIIWHSVAAFSIALAIAALRHATHGS